MLVIGRIYKYNLSYWYGCHHPNIALVQVIHSDPLWVEVYKIDPCHCTNRPLVVGQNFKTLSFRLKPYTIILK